MPDVFSQPAALKVTESASNTLTFQQLTTGAALFERRAMVIHRIQYFVPLASYNLLLDDADGLAFGLTTNSQITSLDLDNPNVIDLEWLSRAKYGVPATGWPYLEPFERDYSTLPGGGIITPAFPVYLFAKGTSLASASSLSCRFWFTARVLKAEEYIELVEASRVVT